MLDQLYYKVYYRVKTLARPLAKHRRLWERAKYSGTRILSPKAGNDLIASSMGRAGAVAKIGSSELAALRHYLRHADSSGHCESWGWQVRGLHRIAGVYPPDPEIMSRFCRTYAKALSHLDLLAVWFNFGEKTVWKRFAPKATLVALTALEPFYHDRPWSQNLAGRRVLVVSPFTDTIQVQYRRRAQIWATKPEVLPDFELLTLRSPMSAFLTPPAYPDWFAALDSMREQMASISFDVAIIGAGAWSVPLVAHARSLGAWAIHLGGATQILFGIKGGRWDKLDPISVFFNEAWTRPSASETPREIDKVEGGCYW